MYSLSLTEGMQKAHGSLISWMVTQDSLLSRCMQVCLFCTVEMSFLTGVCFWCSAQVACWEIRDREAQMAGLLLLFPLARRWVLI